MKKKFLTWITSKQAIEYWIFKLFSYSIIRNSKPLTPQYLLDRGWTVDEHGFYTEPGIKDRDLISIRFENHYYRVWHTKDRIFIALESSIQWFEMYRFLMHSDGGDYKRYRLADV